MKLTQNNVFPPQRVLIVAENLPSNPPGNVLSYNGTNPANIRVELDVTNADHARAAVDFDASTKERIAVGVPVYDLDDVNLNGDNYEQVSFGGLPEGGTTVSLPGLGRTFAVRV